MISPINFIPAAERYHLMSKVDRWVIECVFMAFQQCMKHRQDI